MAKDAFFVKKLIKDSKTSTAPSLRRPSQANTTCSSSILYKKKKWKLYLREGKPL